MKCFFKTLCCILLVGFSVVGHAKTKDADARRELLGRPHGQRPDILVFEIRLTESVDAYLKDFQAIARYGSKLPAAQLSFADFRARDVEGTIGVRQHCLGTMLEAAGYSVLSVSANNWSRANKYAIDFLEFQKKYRELDTEIDPVCLLFSPEVEPDSFYESFKPLLDSDALIILITRKTMHTSTFPLVVIWNRHVWPNHTIELPAIADHWVPTLGEIVGTYLPTDMVAPSILPSLTGVGYQKRIDVKPTQKKTDRVDICVANVDPERLKRAHWIPYVDDIVSRKRAFIKGTLPVKRANLDAQFDISEVSSEPRVIVVRAGLQQFKLDLPKTIPVVIKKDGIPICSSEWGQLCQWQEYLPEPVGIEFSFLIPAGEDPSPVIEFLTSPSAFSAP